MASFSGVWCSSHSREEARICDEEKGPRIWPSLSCMMDRIRVRGWFFDLREALSHLRRRIFRQRRLVLHECEVVATFTKGICLQGYNCSKISEFSHFSLLLFLHIENRRFWIWILPILLG